MSKDSKKLWWFIEDDNETVRYYDPESKTLFMPFNIEPEDYSDIVKEFISTGLSVQLEIV